MSTSHDRVHRVPDGVQDALRRAFEPAHHQRVPGLRAIPAAAWLCIDPDEPDRLRERDALVAQKGAAVVAVAPDADSAVRGFTAQLRRALAAVPGYRLSDGVIQRPDGVVLSGAADLLARATADDWLLMMPGHGSQGFRLVAGSACYPAHWRLQDKLGKPLDVIHAPVPGYATDVAPRVNRIFANLQHNRPLERFNWSIGADGARYTPPEVRRAIAPEGPFLRVERQALLRPVASDVVIFSVRTSMAPLSGLNARLKGQVASALTTMGPAMRGYKFHKDVLEAAWAHLERGAGRF